MYHMIVADMWFSVNIFSRPSFLSRPIFCQGQGFFFVKAKCSETACRVKARPRARVSWLREGRIIERFYFEIKMFS